MECCWLAVPAASLANTRARLAAQVYAMSFCSTALITFKTFHSSGVRFVDDALNSCVCMEKFKLWDECVVERAKKQARDSVARYKAYHSSRCCAHSPRCDVESGRGTEEEQAACARNKEEKSGSCACKEDKKGAGVSK